MRKPLIPKVGFFNVQDSELNEDKNTIEDTKQDAEQDTTQYTNEDTAKMTFQIPSKIEPFSKRLVANVTPSQKAFVQKMSKKFVNESAFVRFMLEKFMKDIEVK